MGYAAIMGEAWYQANLGEKSAAAFFRMSTLEKDADTTIARGVGLGEMLFNLQDVDSFDECIDRLPIPARVEDAFCEIEVGKLLFMWGYEFSFVKPAGIRGQDYDIESKIPDGPDRPRRNEVQSRDDRSERQYDPERSWGSP